MTGRYVVNLPIHSGKAPRWLFERMVSLAEQILIIIAESFSPTEILNRLADPWWFQALGGILGFDWHSSGLTTTTTGALRVVLDRIGPELGIFAAGGKGKTSLKTPEHIRQNVERYGINVDAEKLVDTSRVVAKIDNALVQDGYTLYHHFFVFDNQGRWIVIQQGMNQNARYARRYHWRFDNKILNNDKARIVAPFKLSRVLNLVASASASTRQFIMEFIRSYPDVALGVYKKMLEGVREINFPKREYIVPSLDIKPENLYKILIKTYESQPKDFYELIKIKGVGPKTFRALALVGELVYGTEVSWKDPVKFTYAHGGKDGHPYPINREDYDKTIRILEKLASKLKDKRATDKVRQLLLRLGEVGKSEGNKGRPAI